MTIMATRTWAACAAAAAAAVLTFGGCTSQPTASDPESAPPSTPSATSAPALPTVPIMKTHVFADGVTLRVSEITEAKLGPFPITEDPGAKEGDPYVIVTLEWANRSKAAIELTPLVTPRVGAEGQQAPRVEVDPPDQMNIKPGGSADYDVGLLVSEADRKQVVLEILDAQDPSRGVALTGPLT